jgi:hypothetical protein
MRMNWLFLLILPSGLAAQAADVCDPADLVGPYAFQLTGWTDISGTPEPTAGLGRIAFDGRGNLSGTASATFNGLLLGNPVMGSYEANSDCSVIWKLQDDSGGFQNFSGTVSADGTRVQLAQDGEEAEPSLMAMRGFLVNGGKEILAFQTDPGAMVAARFTSGGK